MTLQTFTSIVVNEVQRVGAVRVANVIKTFVPDGVLPHVKNVPEDKRAECIALLAML